MTDTVRWMQEEIERLRKYTDGVRCPACDTTRLELGEARAEIERLKAENKILAETITVMELLPEIVKEEKDAEIERLREEVAMLKEHIGLQYAAEQDAEIERLRDQVTQLSNTVDIERSLHDIEIEQLRKALAREEEEHNRCTTFHAIAVKERNFERLLVQRQAAEIERLRYIISQVADNIAGAPATIVEHSAEVGKALRRLDKRDAEIKRLRGLVDACSIYLKEDETPAQRIERERADTEAVLKLLVKEKRDNERLREGERAADAEIERLRGLVYAVPPTEQAAGQTWKEACEANRDEVASLDSMLRPLSQLKTEREEG